MLYNVCEQYKMIDHLHVSTWAIHFHQPIRNIPLLHLAFWRLLDIIVSSGHLQVQTPNLFLLYLKAVLLHPKYSEQVISLLPVGLL
jgi:hypothetical protein